MRTLRDLRWLLLLAVTGAACSSILGIEDIHPDPKPGEGGGGEDTSGGTGGAGKGGTSGSGASSGKGGVSGSAGSSGTGGDAGGGGEGEAGGAGASGGSGGAPDDTVRGRVVTHWRQPVPNILVTIGAADAVTNTNGEFEIPDVAPQYDAAFTLTYQIDNATRVYGWVYQGLTRRDPTLMVRDGINNRGGNLSIVFANLVLNGSSALSVGVGDPSGVTYDLTGSMTRSSDWLGPATTTATAHALLWQTQDGLPTAYTSYDSEVIALADGGTTALNLDMGDPNGVTTGTVSGSVTSSTADGRANQAFVRFTSGAVIQVVDDDPPVDLLSFTYNVPSLPGSSTTVSASEDGATGFAVVHRDGLAIGQGNVALSIPSPTLLNAPAPGVTGVDSTTMFRWTGSAGVYLWYIEDDDYYQGLRIITSRGTNTVPVMPDGFTLRADGFHVWRIQTHGDAASVDEMCGPEGYADSFGLTSDIAPLGPRTGNGSYTVSLPRGFTMAP